MAVQAALIQQTMEDAGAAGRCILLVVDGQQQELADQFGTTRPSVGRIIRQLHEENIILAERKQVRILDKPGLINLLNT